MLGVSQPGDTITTEDAAPAAHKAAAAMEIPVILLRPDPTAEVAIFALDVCTACRDLPMGFAQANDAALVLHTSGTTSRPKAGADSKRDIERVEKFLKDYREAPLSERVGVQARDIMKTYA